MRKLTQHGGPSTKGPGESEAGNAVTCTGSALPYTGSALPYTGSVGFPCRSGMRAEDADGQGGMTQGSPFAIRKYL